MGWAIRNLMILLDRARRVVLRTTIEYSGRIPRLIAIGLTQIGCLLHLRISSTIHTVALEIRTLFSNFCRISILFILCFI
jgi:hypothetical protein